MTRPKRIPVTRQDALFVAQVQRLTLYPNPFICPLCGGLKLVRRMCCRACAKSIIAQAVANATAGKAVRP